MIELIDARQSIFLHPGSQRAATLDADHRILALFWQRMRICVREILADQHVARIAHEQDLAALAEHRQVERRGRRVTKTDIDRAAPKHLLHHLASVPFRRIETALEKRPRHIDHRALRRLGDRGHYIAEQRAARFADAERKARRAITARAEREGNRSTARGSANSIWSDAASIQPHAPAQIEILRRTNILSFEKQRRIVAL